MNKEEILAKAQKENQLGDEREKMIELKGYEKSYDIGILACSFLLIISYLADQMCSQFYLIYFIMKATNHCYKAWKLRKKRDIVYALLYGIGSLALTGSYLNMLYSNYLLGR